MLTVKTFPFMKLEFFLNQQYVFSRFSGSKIKCSKFGALRSSTSFGMVDPMLPITVKDASM